MLYPSARVAIIHTYSRCQLLAVAHISSILTSIFHFNKMLSLTMSLQVKGERLYTKARRGEEIAVPPRSVKVYDFQLRRSPQNRFHISFMSI